MQLLLAEDERALSRALVAMLEKSAYRVDAVFDGCTALDCLLQNSYDAAVLDIMMPGMDGIEVVRQARAQGVRIPIIMLTAKGTVADKVEGLDAGANDYLVKPFSVKELMARLRAMTRKNDAFDATPLSVCELTLDRSTCNLSGPAGTEHLPNKEFMLLELFMNNPGQVLSPLRLLEAVWGSEQPDDNVVWVYVSNVRKKLAAVGATSHIKTFRNQGYCLIVDEGVLKQ